MPKFNSRNIRIAIHCGVWLCLFFYPFLFHYAAFTDFFSVLRIALFLGMILMFFYFNTCVLVPKFLGEKKWLLYFLSVALLVTIISMAAGYLEEVLNQDIVKMPQLFNASVNTGLITSFLAWVVSSVMKITEEWMRSQEQRRSIEHEKLQSELSFLRTQVNPHFLFNALNNIYSLQNRHSPLTGEAILKLSGLVRYMLYEASADTVPLEKEVEYLGNYVELQKFGLDEIAVTFEVKGELGGRKIEPMLLVPLVENAFKHGISYVKRTPVIIRLTVMNDELDLYVENRVPEENSPRDKTNGIGLKNLSKRLDLLYRETHILKVGPVGDKYIAELKLKLKK
ncbi:MAG TPA: histidine kinase [Bacteroidia bacterium]|jgi:LytS/YehU family sensor histidine kinase